MVLPGATTIMQIRISKNLCMIQDRIPLSASAGGEIQEGSMTVGLRDCNRVCLNGEDTPSQQFMRCFAGLPFASARLKPVTTSFEITSGIIR
jgi:hypothetical protein